MLNWKMRNSSKFALEISSHTYVKGLSTVFMAVMMYIHMYVYTYVCIYICTNDVQETAECR